MPLLPSYGRARLSLAAAFEQFALWVNPKTLQPAANDCDTWIDQITSAFVFAHPETVSEGMVKATGGNVSWNNGIDYRRLLDLSGRKEMVMELCRKCPVRLKKEQMIHIEQKLPSTS